MSVTQLLLRPDNASDYLSARAVQNKFKQIFTEPDQCEVLDIKKTLLCLARRGESPAEVWAMIQLIEAMEGRANTGVSNVIDVCGTGGDGMQTFNISTVAAFVIAGAGGNVAKHGNRAISSRCGSSDLMESLGVKLNAGPKKMLHALKTCGIAYLHAPHYHPLFAKVQPLRQTLGVRTIFNLIGPFLNPFRHPCQLIGVSKRDQIDFFMEILKFKKIERAAVCNSDDGLDEISTSAATHVSEFRSGRVRQWTLTPQHLGFKKARISDYSGGTASDNRKLTHNLLLGKLSGPKRDIVEINAAMGLYVCGRARNIKDALMLARQSLDHKKAYQALQTLIRISNS